MTPIDPEGGDAVALGAPPIVEVLNDTRIVGGNAREIGTIQDRVLQRACLEQRFLVSDFGNFERNAHTKSRSAVSRARGATSGSAD